MGMCNIRLSDFIRVSLSLLGLCCSMACALTEEFDTNECGSGPCLNGGRCVDGINRFTCSCRGGYKGTLCQIDIDECSSSRHRCDTSTSVCHNSIGSYQCSCRPGYNGPATPGRRATCIDIDECESLTHRCDMRTSVCRNTNGSYECVCKTGYSGSTTTGASATCIGCLEPMGSQYFNGSCYFKVSLPDKPLLSADDAAGLCAVHGGHLAIIAGELENTVVSNAADNEQAWIGAIRDSEDTETFIWPDGSPLTFNNWRKREPNNRIGNEDCVKTNYVRSGLWNDTPCERDRFVRVGVCEKPAPSQSPSAAPDPAV